MIYLIAETVVASNNQYILAIIALSGVIATLFWQLQKSNQKNVEAYKLIAPLVSKLIEVVEDLQPLLDRIDKNGHSKT